MADTLIVVGAGPGISNAVAEKFGKAGFQVALVARNADKLSQQVKQLEGQGIKAISVTADVTDPNAVRAMVKKVREQLGPITVLHWNAAVPAAGDFLTASTDELRSVLDGGVTSLVAAIQEALPDLKANKKSAVLVTNGGYGLFADAVDQIAVKTSSMGLGVANAAKHKATRVLARRLQNEGVYLGEVMVVTTVKGTAWDQGSATLEAAAVGEKFWKLYSERKETHTTVG